MSLIGYNCLVVDEDILGSSPGANPGKITNTGYDQHIQILFLLEGSQMAKGSAHGEPDLQGCIP
jgi:hypothetical protein